ncbi:MAG: hypothetical protein L3J08_09400, partial [Flavobacteriaceae bacterium]|nr:hypothetical protein [Flavobacteriaceae bacterium]
MKKIAFITTTFENTTNGPSKFARLLYEDNLNNDKRIVFYTEDTSIYNELLFKVKIPKFINLSGIGFIYRLYKYFNEVVKNKKNDTVIVNNTMYGFLFNLLTNKKVIGFINDDEHIGFKKQFTYKTIRSSIFSKFEKHGLKNNKFTIVNSIYLKNRIESHYKTKKFPIKILYKGISIDKELNLQKHDNDKILNILFVKTNFNLGGLSILLKAVEEMKDIHLDIVTSEMIKTKKEHELIKKLYSYTLYHKLSQYKVFELMSNAHCLCIPSNKEALGVANMEGMIHSCLVIS